MSKDSISTFMKLKRKWTNKHMHVYINFQQVIYARNKAYGAQDSFYQVPGISLHMGQRWACWVGNILALFDLCLVIFSSVFWAIWNTYANLLIFVSSNSNHRMCFFQANTVCGKSANFFPEKQRHFLITLLMSSHV